MACGGATQWLPIVVGDKRAREMLFTNRPIPAKLALEWGLVNRVAPSVRRGGELVEDADAGSRSRRRRRGEDGYSIDLAPLDEEVGRLAQELLETFPECMRYTKQQVNFWKDLSWAMTVRHAQDWLALHYTDYEPFEGMSAFAGQAGGGLRRRCAGAPSSRAGPRRRRGAPTSAAARPAGRRGFPRPSSTAASAARDLPGGRRRDERDGELSGRVAFVTGGASGIGLACARELARRGARVSIADADARAPRRPRAPSARRTSMRSTWRTPGGAPAVAESSRGAGRLDILVLAAGICRDAVLWKMTDDAWSRVIDVDLSGAAHVLRAAAPALRRRRSGRVVFISSINGRRGKFGQSNYAAAKAGLLGLARSAARELAASGVTVNVVEPGFTATPMTAGLPPEVRRRALAETPLGRVGRPEDVAAAVAFFAGPGRRAHHGPDSRRRRRAGDGSVTEPALVRGWEMSGAGKAAAPGGAAASRRSRRTRSSCASPDAASATRTSASWTTAFGRGTRLPLILGHEISGVHRGRGRAASAALIGEAVVVPAVLPCGVCAACRTGRAMTCRAQVMPGNDCDGGFATRVVLPDRGICPVPGAGADPDAPLGAVPA